MPIRAVVAALLVFFAVSAAAPVLLSATTNQSETIYTTYTIKRGEGLADVARTYGVDLQELIRLNRDRLPNPDNPNVVFTGMQVRVPIEAPTEPEPEPVPEPLPTEPEPEPVEEPAPEPPPAPVAPEPVEAPLPAQPDEPEAPPFDGTESAIVAFLEDVPPWAPWVAGAILLACILGLIAALFAKRASQTISMVATQETDDLKMVAVRNLGGNSRLYWFKAGDKDLFVSTGAETQIVAPDKTDDAKSVIETPPPSRTTPSTRRPRKSAPSAKQQDTPPES